MDKLTLGVLLICLHVNISVGANQRLQNANLDFLNFEANNPKVTPSPSPTIAQKPLPQNPIRDYVAPTKPSNVRQIVKTFNDHLTDSDKIPDPNAPVNPTNKNVSPTSTTTTIQPKGPTAQPSTTTTGNKLPNQNVQPVKPVRDYVAPTPGNKLPNQNVQPANPVRDYVAPTPGNKLPNQNVQPAKPIRDYVAPGNRPNQNVQPATTTKPTTVRESFPSLPISGGATKLPTATSTPPKSWSSVVSGNKPSGNVANTGTRLSTNVQPNPIKPNNAPTARPNPTQSTTASSTAAVIATDEELKTMSEALFKKETNLGKYFTINIQGKTTSFSKDDVAPEPLVTIEPDLWKVPTIAAMKVLLDNYEQNTTVNEYVTPQEKNEENNFLDLIMATPVMRHLMVFLKDKNLVSPDPKQQRDLIKQIWFNMYSRGQGKIGSSGFEHIFLSEIKNNEVSGLHNWLYFQTEEALRNVNYLGYMKKLDFNAKSGILKLHFVMKGIDKPVDTIFIGTSPELEMSLYTLCFLTRVDQACPLSAGQQQFNLRTHNFRYRSKNMIGSAFPEI